MEKGVSGCGCGFQSCSHLRKDNATESNPTTTGVEPTYHQQLAVWKGLPHYAVGVMPTTFDSSQTSLVQNNSYEEHPDVIDRSDDEVRSYLAQSGATLVGRDIPGPVLHFKEGNFPEYIDKCLVGKRFDKPTFIQSQAWPIAMSGRDMVGIAPTGSGKTLAYVLPGLVHISRQTAASSNPKDGPMPDRQTLMFSATWPKEVHRLADMFMADYIRVHIGSLEFTANHQITQIIDVVDESEKIDRLCKLVSKIMAQEKNKILVFVNMRSRVSKVVNALSSMGFPAMGIHGGKSQKKRDDTLAGFRIGCPSILVATDVAARGLDVDDIKVVINMDFPFRCEDYVHRIGRTGRSNNTGTAYSFFSMTNIRHGKKLVDILQEAKQVVNPSLLKLIRTSKGSGGGGAAETPAVAPPA